MTDWKRIGKIWSTTGYIRILAEMSLVPDWFSESENHFVQRQAGVWHLKSNSHDLGTRCFVSKKELIGPKSVSGEPTESNHSQYCDISLQRTWKTRPHSHVHQLCIRPYVPKWLTRGWPQQDQGSTSSSGWQWRMTHMSSVLMIVCFDFLIISPQVTVVWFDGHEVI